MAYQKTGIIARRGYGGPASMGGVLQKIEDAAKGAGSAVLNFYGQAQKDAGAAQLAAQQAALQQQQARGGISTTTLLIGGAAAVGLVLLLRKS